MSQRTAYRISETDRTVGAAATPSEGFVLVNLTNGNCFTVAGGIWTSTPIPTGLIDAWALEQPWTPGDGGDSPSFDWTTASWNDLTTQTWNDANIAWG